MSTPTPAPSVPLPPDHIVSQLSQKALQLMQQYNILPTPENYSVWFHFVLGRNGDLVKEVEHILKNKVPLTHHTHNYLYHKYIIADANQKVIGDAAAGANKLLGEILKAVTDFKGETSDYNEGVDTYMQKLTVDIPDAGVQSLVKDLLSATVEIKERGETLNKHLEDSQKEIEVLKENLKQVTNESKQDFLTGVFNRKSLDRMLEEQINAAKDTNTELCLLMLDIDHFKGFNDKFGHLLGDEVLKIVARALTDCVRGKDIVARYGGEEFCVVLTTTPMVGALKVAESIRTTIATRELKRKDTGELYGQITVSVGVAQFRPQDVATTFIKRADDALYHSKRSGRNRVTQELT